MRYRLAIAAILPAIWAGAALAEVPSVATDIPPIQSLVARVMDGVGTPDLIVQPGASPHAYSLRPSEARALQDADIVFWVGEALTPWLATPIGSLAGNANSVQLMQIEGTTLLEFREGARFEPHEHGDAPHDAEDPTHADDPHVWLDPENARLWLDAIAQDLSRLDAENADIYTANALAGRDELAQLITDIERDLIPVRGTGFIVFHDAFHYFENRFDIFAAGSITLGDASDPSPARIAAVRDTLSGLGIGCAFSEPQFNPGLLEGVFEHTEAKLGVLDPLGADLAPGPDLYPQLIRNLAETLSRCLERVSADSP